jgi:hypothetical protein
LAALWVTYGQPISGLLLPTLVATVVMSLAGAWLAAAASGRSFKESVLYVSPFVWLGGVIGLIAGASQEPIVGGFVTGILAAVTGLFSYIFAKDAVAKWRPVLSVAAVFLCFSAVLGLSLGRIHKAQWDEYQRAHAIWLLDHEKVRIPSMAVQQRFDLCQQRISRANLQQCDALLTK